MLDWPVTLSLAHVLTILLIGLFAGFVGGLAGVGGSLVMLPALGLLFGYDEPERTRQHVFIAAAMIVNAFIAIPATWQHARHGAILKSVVTPLIPTMVLGIAAGVGLSIFMSGRGLVLLLAGFMFAYCALNAYRLIARHEEAPRTDVGQSHRERVALSTLGGFTGIVAGLLGIGGGVVLVPAMQLFLRIPLRNAIAASAATMCLSAAVGSILKLISLRAESVAISDALLLAAMLAPTATGASILGARAAQRLPLPAVRLAISVILGIAAARLALR
ncbi:MAG: sulfite exporter TauE/SafE family protein [Planctomycetota bacterium]|nr:sulfite exporter TauE/SafE family protein [Planctomycetota bacterium]